MKWHLTVVLKCISLKIINFAHLFMCISHLFIFFGEYSSPSPVLKVACLFLLLLSCWSLGYLQDITLIRFVICKHFLLFHGLPFPSVNGAL